MNNIQSQKTTSITLLVAVGAVTGAIAGIVVSFAFLWFTGSFLTTPSQETRTQRGMVQLIEEESATISVVKQVAPSVVSVVVRKPASVLRNGSFFGLEDGEKAGDELVDIGGGTAFFVSNDGLLLTNRHVVSDRDAEYFVVTDEGTEYAVDVVARDTLYDVAVLRITDEKVPSEGFHAVTLGADSETQIGQTVIAIGNALAEFNNTVTKGIISGKERKLIAGGAAGSELIQEAIQTDAAINPGNSGGPLINLFGEVIGINTAVSRSGEGVGFAIPIRVASEVVDDIEKYGRIVRPWLGVRFAMLDDSNSEKYGFAKEQRGAYIFPEEITKSAGVVEDSPAARSGLKEGDLIVKVEGETFKDDETLAQVLNMYEPGDQVQLEVLREGDTIVPITVELGEFDESVLQ